MQETIAIAIRRKLFDEITKDISPPLDIPKGQEQDLIILRVVKIIDANRDDRN